MAERRRFDPHTHRGAAGPAPAIPREPKPVALSHPEGIVPAARYRLRQIHPSRTHGGDPEFREVEVEGAILVEKLLGANQFPARVVGPRVVFPLLDLFNQGVNGPLWCDANEVRSKLADGFVILSADGYVLNYGPHAGSALAGRVWSGWRKREEAKAHGTG
jgi:hypothetical protein